VWPGETGTTKVDISQPSEGCLKQNHIRYNFPMKKETVSPPILILGCGRSGTSIFGELFESLDGYHYLSEPSFLEIVSSFGDGIAVKVPTESIEFPADPGLSFPLQSLLEVAPTTRIFWIVRHPLDAICSLRIGIGKDWKHHPRPPDWQVWLDKPLIERCAHHWIYINSVGFDAVSNIATVVRFEDMIDAPSIFAARAIASAGLVVSDHQLSVQRWADRIQNTNNEKFVEALTSRHHSRPDHSVRVGRWRENLSTQEVQKALSMVANTNQRFGYEL